jgi:hypothetical protein
MCFSLLQISADRYRRDRFPSVSMTTAGECFTRCSTVKEHTVAVT